MKRTKTNMRATAALVIAVVVLLAIVATITAVGIKYCWFGHKYNDENVCERCGAEKEVEPAKEEDVNEDAEETAYILQMNLAI